MNARGRVYVDEPGRGAVATFLQSGELRSVSHETMLRLELLVKELRRWQSVKNLVANSTMDQVWTRHVLDSLQLLPLGPATGSWLDLGSGGGFPGVVVGIVRTLLGTGRTYLLESNGRKCAFLRHAARVTGSDIEVVEGRIEAIAPRWPHPTSVVSARALAPLPQLLSWSSGLLRTGAVGIFPKGQDVEMEIKAAATSWDFKAELHQSLTDRDGRVVVLRMSQTRDHPDVASA